MSSSTKKIVGFICDCLILLNMHYLRFDNSVYVNHSGDNMEEKT